MALPDFWNTEKKPGKYVELFNLHIMVKEENIMNPFQSRFHHIRKLFHY